MATDCPLTERVENCRPEKTIDSFIRNKFRVFATLSESYNFRASLGMLRAWVFHPFMFRRSMTRCFDRIGKCCSLVRSWRRCLPQAPRRPMPCGDITITATTPTGPMRRSMHRIPRVVRHAQRPTDATPAVRRISVIGTGWAVARCLVPIGGITADAGPVGDGAALRAVARRAVARRAVAQTAVAATRRPAPPSRGRLEPHRHRQLRNLPLPRWRRRLRSTWTSPR